MSRVRVSRRGFLLAGVLVVGCLAPLLGWAPSTGAFATYTCFGAEPTMLGTAGADTLTGTSGKDVIVGLGGSDTIYGLEGPDLICGGGAADTIDGGMGRDRISGDAGNDVILDGIGDDVAAGGDGNDRFVVGPGANQLQGGAGDDRFVLASAGSNALAGGPGSDSIDFTPASTGQTADLAAFSGVENAVGSRYTDQLTGTSGANHLAGMGGNDLVFGGGGGDSLEGGAGNDTLRGGAGDDNLDGGNGIDLVDGGIGTDTCYGENRQRCELPPAPAFDVGVNLGPCPDAVNPGNGCIYLGVLSDFSGPHAARGPLLLAGHEDFWARVNGRGGIGPEGGPKFDVIIKPENVRDTGSSAGQAVVAYQQIRGNVAALAETFGTSQTLAVLPLLAEDDTIAAAPSWYSGWSFPGIDHGLILEAGTNLCFEGMNAFDFADGVMQQVGLSEFTYAIVAFPDAYGEEYSFGVEQAAEQRGLGAPVIDIPQTPLPMGGSVDDTVAALVMSEPDVIFVATGPIELAGIMGGVYSGGHPTAVYFGAEPTWSTALLATAIKPLVEAAYFQTAYWLPWSTDTPGHNALRAAADAAGRDPSTLGAAYSAGWVTQYALKAALEKAITNGDLTRAGIAAAVDQLTDVDYEGMLPNRGFAGTANDDAWRGVSVNVVNSSQPDGVTTLTGYWIGPTAAAYEFSEPCAALGG